MLGPLEVLDGGRSLPLAGEKQRALLALLVINANRVVPRDRLVDELWGEEPPPTAVTTVQIYVSRLRKVLPSGVLRTRPRGYVLEVDPDAIDLHRFEQLLASARHLDPQPASARLREALALWRGTPLAEFDEPFARVDGGRLEELRLGALEDRIDADLASGRQSALVAELQTLVVAHPHRERLRRQFVIALYRSGRQIEALDAFREALAMLDELGLEPGDELRGLERMILTHDPGLAAPDRARVPRTSSDSPARMSRISATPAADAGRRVVGGGRDRADADAPSVNPSHTRSATATARRVLPTPPGPDSVTGPARDVRENCCTRRGSTPKRSWRPSTH